ncbi:hypothetical protein KP509_05G035400 [Ceratopteris richardii]|uniref:Thiomorpholine-carboxylate dehydrogenase n=1 Tax=Ceratopteris richardii TaxID=49495 RepID=A0A8T2UQB2_CERRI|nr:hypothetical protein KP509_05G035400 [Ceratopteris richardii]
MEGFKVIDGAQISSSLSYPALIDHLHLAFRHADAVLSPPRHHHALPGSSSSSSYSSAAPTLLLMPAWPCVPSAPSSSYMGVKIVSVFPHNSFAGMPSVSASYLLSSALTGVPLAFLDGGELTLWRTSCVSGLASRHLSNPESRILLMVGAGAMAPHLIEAHCTARPSIKTVLIWNRTHSKAESLAQKLQDRWKASECKHCGNDDKAMTCRSVSACSELENAARMADIVCCATLSEAPLIKGSWLRPGSHLDLVGSFNPNMRECDNDAINQAMVFVDTPAAIAEAGELTGNAASVKGSLSELVKGEKEGRTHSETFTVFKSVGSALVDLATAQMIYQKLHSPSAGVTAPSSCSESE